MWLAAVGGAWALEATVRAVVSPDLRELHGTLTFVRAEGEGEPRWIDPLAHLPSPTDDRARLRAFPGPPNEGSVRWTRDGTTLTFSTQLPERNGDVGWTRRRGLRANGGWLPTPVDDAGRPLVVTWDARLDVERIAPDAIASRARWHPSPDIVLLVNDARAVARAGLLPTRVPAPSTPGGVAEGPQPSAPEHTQAPAAGAYWSGRADRLAIAAFVEGREDLDLPRTSANGAPRHAVHLSGNDDAYLLPAGVTVNVVVGPDDGRLVHVGPGIVYLSERAFRVWPLGLRRWHAPSVRAAVLGAGCARCASGLDRALLGRLRAGSSHFASRRGLRPPGLGKLVDMAMQDPAIPAWSDMYDRPWLRTSDLYETLAGAPPAESIAMQLEALEGTRFPSDSRRDAETGMGLVRRIANLLGEGVSIRDALTASGTPPTLIESWLGPDPGSHAPASRPPAPASTELSVEATDTGAIVRRSAPQGSPTDVIPLVVDGRAGAWLPDNSTDGSTQVLALPGAHRVEVDAGGATPDVERGDNRLPRRWSTRPYGGIYALNLTEGTFDAGLFLVLRHRGDTRHTWYVAGAHDAQDLASVRLGHGFGFGRLVRPRARSWRLNLLGGATLLDPTFDSGARLPTGATSVDAEIGLTRDTLEDAFFPLEGTRWTLDAEGGYVTMQDAGWTRLGVTTVRILAPHPRHALAARLRAGAAFGAVANRLLPLGGADDVRGLGESVWLCHQRASASLEYRARVMANAALPLGVGWLTDLHLSPGIDVGLGRRGTATAAVVGATGGVHGSLDILGLLPVSGGVTVGWPLASRGATARGPQLYLDAQHPF